LKLRQIFFILKIPASGNDCQNTGLLPASAKLAVKYRPSGNPSRNPSFQFLPVIAYVQWRAEEGGKNGATAPGIQGRGHPKVQLQKI